MSDLFLVQTAQPVSNLHLKRSWKSCSSGGQSGHLWTLVGRSGCSSLGQDTKFPVDAIVCVCMCVCACVCVHVCVCVSPSASSLEVVRLLQGLYVSLQLSWGDCWVKMRYSNTLLRVYRLKYSVPFRSQHTSLPIHVPYITFYIYIYRDKVTIELCSGHISCLYSHSYLWRC